ncbi:MAG: PEP-CTERM sorting domain-containing protein [Planctomycetia bacterium]|nr:PEP-CTERM sorting domain-containing protein [Planctomycetia bacterium]
MTHNHWKPFRRAGLLAAATAMLATLGLVMPTRADTLDEYLLAVAGILIDTKLRVDTPKEEMNLINVAAQQYLQEGGSFGLRSIGQAILKGQFPAAMLDPGTTGTLTFQYIDPTTSLPTAGPTVTEVDYSANLDPNNPSVYTPLGFSSDAGSNFALPYTMGLSEAEIRATPLGPGGAIFIGGLGGFNVAEGYVAAIVPEPAAWLLLGIGASLLAMLKWRKFAGRAAWIVRPSATTSLVARRLGAPDVLTRVWTMGPSIGEPGWATPGATA